MTPPQTSSRRSLKPTIPEADDPTRSHLWYLPLVSRAHGMDARAMPIACPCRATNGHPESWRVARDRA